MHEARGALLHVGTEIDSTVEKAFNHWCEGHVRSNLDLPGFQSVRRFARRPANAGADDLHPFLTLYELDDASALTTEAYASHDQSMPTEFTGHLRFARSVFREIRAPRVGDTERKVGSAILHVFTDADPGHEEDVLRWYWEEHVAAVVATPGLICARLFENDELAADCTLAAGQHAYLALYELEDADVLSRPETIRAAKETPCPPALAPHRRVAHCVYEQFFAASRASDGVPATV